MASSELSVGDRWSGLEVEVLMSASTPRLGGLDNVPPYLLLLCVA